MRTNAAPLRLGFYLLLGGGLACLAAGCGGASTYSYNPGDLAQRFLPTEQEVNYHPDTLGALTIRETDGRVRFELSDTYEELHRKWSSTYQDLGTGRSRRGRSYATFWSLELELASLQSEMGITSLTKERARKALAERRQGYENTLRVDVYWFEGEGNSLLAGPGTRVQLRIDGEKAYRPTEQEHGPLREAFLPGRAGSALYRLNTFYFSRVADSTDILRDAQEVELIINRTGAGSRVRFAWSWEAASEGRARLPSAQRRWAEGPTSGRHAVPSVRLR